MCGICGGYESGGAGEEHVLGARDLEAISPHDVLEFGEGEVVEGGVRGETPLGETILGGGVLWRRESGRGGSRVGKGRGGKGGRGPQSCGENIVKYSRNGKNGSSCLETSESFYVYVDMKGMNLWCGSVRTLFVPSRGARRGVPSSRPCRRHFSCMYVCIVERRRYSYAHHV